MRLTRRIQVALIGVIVAGLAVAAPTAQALAPTAPALQSGGADRTRLMSTGDIPQVLGRFGPAGVGEPVDPIITLCQDADNTLTSVPAPERLTQVVSTSVSGARLYRSVTEDVYQFASARAALSAFQGLQSAASGCTGTTSLRDDEGGYTQTIALTTGRAPAAGSGAVWTQQRTAYLDVVEGSALAGSRDVLRRVFVRAGNAIIVTTYYVKGVASITARQADAVVRLAASNADRWTVRR